MAAKLTLQQLIDEVREHHKAAPQGSVAFRRVLAQLDAIRRHPERGDRQRALMTPDSEQPQRSDDLYLPPKVD